MDWKDTSAGMMTTKQRKMLNAICGDLAGQLHWKGHHLDKNEWRHLLSGVVLGQRMMPGWDHGDGRPTGFIVLGRSSLEMTRQEATDAISMAIQLGDDPSSQGMASQPVRWSDAVLLGMGFNPADFH